MWIGSVKEEERERGAKMEEAKWRFERLVPGERMRARARWDLGPVRPRRS